MINKSVLIEYKDMFHNYSRIKRINKHYKLFYDRMNKLFIIINTAKNDEICLKFKSFNLNIEQILQKTCIQNFFKLNRKIEEHNKNLENATILKCKSDFQDKSKDLIAFSGRTNKILQSDINKILGVKND